MEDNKMVDITTRILNIINSTIETKIGEKDFECNFKDIGIDSITYVKIIIQVENEFDIEVDDEALFLDSMVNVKNLLQYISEKLKMNNN